MTIFVKLTKYSQNLLRYPGQEWPGSEV